MKHSIFIIATVVLVTVLLRFLPFLIFGEKRQTPKIIMRLGAYLPSAIMGMLVVYCLKDTNPLSSPFGIPELIGCVAVALLHIWRRNTLLSIGGGTAIYMLLVQLVF